MLKATILAAVATAKGAVADLAVVVSHVERGAAVHVPGSAPTYPETLTDVSVVFSKYDSKELEDTTIMASDYKGLVFPESSLPDIKANDFIRVPSGLRDILAGDYRVIKNDRVMAGDTVALHQLQLRMS